MDPKVCGKLLTTHRRGYDVDVKALRGRFPLREGSPPGGIALPEGKSAPAVTFYSREIPSWILFRRSARGGIDHGGLLHQHHSLSDDV